MGGGPKLIVLDRALVKSIKPYINSLVNFVLFQPNCPNLPKPVFLAYISLHHFLSRLLTILPYPGPSTGFLLDWESRKLSVKTVPTPAGLAPVFGDSVSSWVGCHSRVERWLLRYNMWGYVCVTGFYSNFH